jgi:hypothetical protein
MVNVMRLVFTIVLGLLWWWTWTFAGPPLQFLVILGSILTLCVCCCTGHDPSSEWSIDRYMACLRRCGPALLVLMVGLFLLGILVVLISTGAFPAAAVLLRILAASVGSVVFVRAICCAYQA